MLEYHYGYEKNECVCTCGKHFGCGTWIPEQRAAHAARMRDTMPSLLPDITKSFLIDFEKHHGRVHYRMDLSGIGTGEFIKKGEAYKIPIYDNYAY